MRWAREGLGVTSLAGSLPTCHQHGRLPTVFLPVGALVVRHREHRVSLIRGVVRLGGKKGLWEGGWCQPASKCVEMVWERG